MGMKGLFTNKISKLILMGLLIMAVAAGCGQKKGGNNAVTSHTGSALKTEQTEQDVDVLVEDGSQPLYIVEDLNMTEETIALYSIDEAKQYRYGYNMTTKFLDKYGDNSTWAEFTIGSVVTIGDFLPSSGALGEVKKSTDVWILDDLSKYSIDESKNLIAINGSNYKLTGNTKVYSDTEKILVSDIGKDDIITVIGREKEVISIAVTTGHGYLYLSDTSLFDDSMIFIGNKIVSMVNGDEIIEVPEGTYKITVANNGWGGSGEYTVVRNETTQVSLEDLKGDGPSFCLITFLVTVPDTHVYIDGQEVDVTEPQYVQYGSHSLKVQCQGYTSWNKTLVVNSESATITLELESETGTSSADEYDNTTEKSQENDDSESSENEPETETAGSTIKDDYDYEVDYLSTVSDLISNLME
jgi:hypothetical protein